MIQKSEPKERVRRKEDLDYFRLCPLCSGPRFQSVCEFGNIHVYQCTQCQMMFLSPYLKASEMERIFSSHEELVKISPFFERYLEEESWNTKKTLAIYKKCLRELKNWLPQGGKLLDVGCGKGAFLRLAKNEGWSVQGLETSQESVKELKEKWGIEVVEKNFLSLHESGSCWDVISMWDLIEHVPNPGRWVDQCHCRLKSGGLLVVATPNHHSLLDLLSLNAYRGSLGRLNYGVAKLYTIDHTLYFTEKTLKVLLVKQGFEILKSMRVNTDLDRYSMSPLFRFVSETLLVLSRLFHLENRIVLIARKSQSYETATFQ